MSGVVRIFLYRYGAAACLKNYVKALDQAAGMEPVVSNNFAPAAGCAGRCPGGYDSDPALYGQENVACRNIDRDGTKKNGAPAPILARGSRFSASAEAAS